MSKINNNISVTKKLSFFSAIMFVIGTTIGAGIFIKNNEVLNNTHYSILFSIIAWVIVLVGILLMSVCILEIATANSKNVIIENISNWVRIFCNEKLYNGCLHFMSYLYVPLSVIGCTYYAIKQFLLGINVNIPFYWIILIALCIIIYFIYTSLRSIKIVNAQNIITLFAKFIPIVVACFIGFLWAILNPANATGNSWILPAKDIKDLTTTFSNITPIIGIFMSIPSILFTVDGFYSSLAIKDKMTEPKKIGKAIFIGLLITEILYLIISISLFFGSTQGGTLKNFDWLTASKPGKVMYMILQILIAIGILGVVNGICYMGVETYTKLIQEKKIVFQNFFSKYFKSESSLCKFYCYGINILYFVVLSFAGCFFVNTDTDKWGDENTQRLFSMINVITNWVALFAFLTILFAVIGCLINRKTNKVEVKKTRFFKFSAIYVILLLSISFLFSFIGSIGNIVIFSFDKTDINNGHPELIGSIIMFVIMIVFCFVMFWPTIYGIFKKNKKSI